MGTTTNLKLPYPEPSDPADGPDAIGDLARATEDFFYTRTLPSGVVRAPSYFWGQGTAFPTIGLVAGDTYQHTTLGMHIWNGTGWDQLAPLKIANFAARPKTGLYNGMKIQLMDMSNVTMTYSTTVSYRVSGAAGIWVQEGIPNSLAISSTSYAPDGSGVFKFEQSSVPTTGGGGGQVVCPLPATVNKVMMHGGVTGDNAGGVGYVIGFPAGNSTTQVSFLAYGTNGAPLPNGTAVRVNFWAYVNIL